MKNLPEDELFDQLGDRLRHYSEEPDDQLWDKIAGASNSRKKAGWIKFADPASVLVSVASIIFLLSVGITEINSLEGERIAGGVKTETKSGKSKGDASDQQSIEAELGRTAAEANQILSGNKVSKIKSSTSVKVGSRSKIEIRRTYQTELNTISFEATSSSAHNLINEIQIANSSTDKVLVEHDAFNTTGKNFSKGYFTKNSDPDRMGKDSVVAEMIKVEDSIKQAKKPIDETIKREKKRLNFYVSLTPLLSYYKVDPFENDGIVIDRIQSPTTLSNKRLGVSVEFGVQGMISKRLEYYGGISYSQQKVFLNYQYRSETGNAVENTNTAMTFDIEPGNHEQQVEYQKKNMGIQAGILFQLKGGSLVQKIGGGLLYQQGIQKRIENETYNNARSSYLFYQLVYRNEYSINNAVKIFIQPNLTRLIYSNEQLNEPFNVKPYWVGLSVGAIYKF